MLGIWPKKVHDKCQSPQGPRKGLEAILEHLPQVRLIARRIQERLPDSISIDDLISTGVVGLISAIDNFDPGHNVKLKTYAEYKIRGAILDSLRGLDWAPRQKRRKSKQIEAAIAALDEQTRSGRPLVSRDSGNAAGDDTMDLLDRMRAGFDIKDVDHEWIDVEERWFINHPDYLDRTFKRGERYLYHIVGELEARRMPLELDDHLLRDIGLTRAEYRFLVMSRALQHGL